MYVVCVMVQVVPAGVEEFLDATLENARASRREPGNLRFDVLRTIENPARFTLYEAYRDEADFLAHQRTPHYLQWKGRVAALMACPRVGEKHHSVFPEPWA